MCCYKLPYSSCSNIFYLNIPISIVQFLDISQRALHRNVTGTFLCKVLSNLFKCPHLSIQIFYHISFLPGTDFYT